RQGRLVPWTLGAGGRRQRTPEGEQTVLPAPLGDLVAAANSTGIPNITTLLAMPMSPRQARLVLPGLSRLLAVPALRTWMSRPRSPVRPAGAGPRPASPSPRHSYAWAKATDQNGHAA